MYRDTVLRKVRTQRLLHDVTLELTYQCNLDCFFCYNDREKPGTLLSLDQYRTLLEDLARMQTLFLMLTGGEPMVHPHFFEIGRMTKELGFVVRVRTNGHTLSPRNVERLRQEVDPYMVEVSLHGASAETHDRITGHPGSFTRTLQGIEKLLEQGFHVGLKSVLLTLNIAEFSAIEDLARRYGTKFRIDAAVFPTLAGERGPLGLRVSPEQAVAVEMSSSERSREWQEYVDNFRLTPYGNCVFACSAGRTNFHVDPDGMLYPCLIARSYRYSLVTGNFAHGWNHEISRIREESAAEEFPCRSCDKRLLCGFCPGFFELEHGQSQVPSDYVCAIGELRHKYICNERSGG